MSPTRRAWSLLIVLLASVATVLIINANSGDDEPPAQAAPATVAAASSTAVTEQSPGAGGGEANPPAATDGSADFTESAEPGYTVDGVDSTRPPPAESPDRDQLEYRLGEFARIYYSLDTSLATVSDGPGAADSIGQQFIAQRRSNVQQLLEKQYVNEAAAQQMRDALQFNSELDATSNATLVEQKIVLSATAQLTRYDAWVKNGNPDWLTISPLHIARSYSGERVQSGQLPEILSNSEWQYTAATGWMMVYFWS